MRTLQYERQRLTASQLGVALGGHRVGSSWMARCPAHRDRTPSLAIRNGMLGPVLRCHAGCTQQAVMTALQARGLWGREVKIPREIELPPVWSGEDHKEAKRRRDGAMRIWNACRNPEGTPVERYLEGRCLELPDCADLKYHPSLKHRDGGKWPAMVCLIRDPISRKPLGIHRTFLTGDGRKAPVSAAKVMLGSCQGGVLALAEPRDQLLVAEGIENALSGQQVVKLPAWAALSAGNMSAIRLPGTLARVTILADRDDSGRAAAHDACRVWRAAYRALDARIAWPEPEYGDFNDQLVAEKMKEADHVSH